MPMPDPLHPGETLREELLPALDLPMAAFTRRLGFARETLSRILHGHAPISPDLAVRLGRAHIGNARTWPAVQADWDLWQAEHRQQPEIGRFSRIG